MATTSEATNIKPDHNALGKAAFIIGVIGLVLSFIPIIGFVSWLLGPLAVLFGLIALRRPSRSLAIAGIITGVIAVFICVSWIKATQSAVEAMNADAFNSSGKSVDNSSAPIMAATIKGIWEDVEENKIAAGRRYGGRRLAFSNEAINEFGGDAANPRINFIGKEEQYLTHLVSASFSAADADRISGLRRGDRVSFVCQNIRETWGRGYSLGGCSLR